VVATAQANGATAEIDAEEEKRRKKAEILAKFKAKKAAEAGKPKEEAAWMPWEDPGALHSAPAAPPPAAPPQVTAPPPTSNAANDDDDVDPLDAFMAAEVRAHRVTAACLCWFHQSSLMVCGHVLVKVMPEVKAAEDERRKVQEEERIAKAKLLAVRGST
jgi:hypothetical protein